MEISNTRRENMRALAEIHGSANLARMLGYRQPSFVSQMIGPNPTRTVSERNAREYERALKLPHSYLDAPLFRPRAAPSASVVPPSQDLATQIADIIRAVSKAVQATGANISVDQFAKLLVVEVSDAADNCFKVREQQIKQMLELIS